MKNTIALLDRARKLCSPANDYQLAKRLGISQQRISNCRHRNGTLDNEAAWKLAKMLEMPVPDVIAYMEEDRAKTDDKREFWRNQLPRALPSIAIALATTLGAGITLIDGKTRVETPSENETRFTPQHNNQLYPIYIMRIGA